MATVPPSSESFPRDLVVRPEILARDAGIVYLEPLQPYAPPQEDGGGLPAMWQLIRGRRRTILVMALLGTAAGLGISLIETTIYDASDTLEFQSTRYSDAMFGAV